MTTLRQLSYLVALADSRNFRRAADAVHVAQPTLSQQANGAGWQMLPRREQLGDVAPHHVTDDLRIGQRV